MFPLFTHLSADYRLRHVVNNVAIYIYACEWIELKTLQVIYNDVISIYKPSDRDHYAVFDFLILKICIKYRQFSAIWLLHYHISCIEICYATTSEKYCLVVFIIKIMLSFTRCAVLLIEISGNIINIFVFINQIIMAVMVTTDITMATDYTISTRIWKNI